MTDTLNDLFTIAYFFRSDRADFTANVTDNFFENRAGFAHRKQIYDLNVEISPTFDFGKDFIVAIDVGGIGVSKQFMDTLIASGCQESTFRKMTVEGASDLLWQIRCYPAYRLLNQDLKRAPDHNVYRGPLENIDLELYEYDKQLVGCIEGREDYQETIFSSGVYNAAVKQHKISCFFDSIPIYNDFITTCLKNYPAVELEKMSRITDEFLNVLRGKELLMFLDFSKINRLDALCEKIYEKIKRSSLPFEFKKKAQIIHKAKIALRGHTS
jgi:hypothetical protein